MATLRCNKIDLWECPEHIAKMCIHEIEHPSWALERYLVWAEQNDDHSAYVRRLHEKAVCAVMNDTDIKVWLDK